MKHINSYDNYDAQNEGLKTWLYIATLLVNLKVFPSNAIETKPREVKQLISSFSQKDRDTIEFIGKVHESGTDNIFKIKSIFEDFKSNTTSLQNVDFLSHLNYINTSNNIPFKTNVFLVDVNLAPLSAGYILKNVPIWGIKYNYGNNLSLDLTSNFKNSISLNLDLSKSLKLTFISYPGFSAVGFRKTI